VNPIVKGSWVLSLCTVIFCAVFCAILSAHSLAQDASSAFEELVPESAASKPKPAVKPKKKPRTKSGPKIVAGSKSKPKAAKKTDEELAAEAEGVEALSEDAGLDSSEEVESLDLSQESPVGDELNEDLSSEVVTDSEEAPGSKEKAAAPAAPPAAPRAAPSVATPSAPEQSPAVADSLENESAMPQALLEESDPGSGLDPEEQFFRIPLRPAMSDANWSKWAGPSIEKFYRVRRGDTLWTISERLFGTPYLWPKVWQLNAQFLNPHIIEVGQELQFIPGNTNSAPVLAFKRPDGVEEDLSLFVVEERLSLLERLESVLLTQMLAPDPPFRFFLKESKPIPVGSMPTRRGEDRMLYAEGDRFNIDMADGTYSVIRGFPMRDRVTRRASFQGWSVEWIGVVDVKNGRGHLRRAFSDVRPGDELTMEEFSLAPLSVHMSQVDPEERRAFKFAPIQMGQMILPGSYGVVGLQMRDEELGPKEGGIVKFFRRNVFLGTGVVLHRSGRLATVWLADSTREVVEPDEIR
jgi:nucleoid-associated protein YgaU